MTIRKFYDKWPQYNQRMIDVVAGMSDEELAIQPSPDGWPIWATVGHTAGGRVYWLCVVAGEPGIEETPFDDPANAGWEDDLSHPRSAEELVLALQSTFAIVEGCLDRWTPEMVEVVIERSYADQVQTHSRSSILQRLLTHDAYHCGELSQTLGIHDLAQVDLWRSAPA